LRTFLLLDEGSYSRQQMTLPQCESVPACSNEARVSIFTRAGASSERTTHLVLPVDVRVRDVHDLERLASCRDPLLGDATTARAGLRAQHVAVRRALELDRRLGELDLVRRRVG